MERLHVVFVICIVLTLGAFTFYYFNTQILLAPQPPTIFNVQGSLAPFGVTKSGTYGVIPSGSSYLFYYSPDGVVADTLYSIDTADPNVQKGLLNIYEAFSDTYPIINGGTYYRNNAENILSPLAFSQVANVIFSHQISGNIVSLNYVETLAGVTTEKQFDIEIVGKTLVIKTYAINPSTSHINNYAGLSLGEIINANSATAVQVPYMKTATVSLINGQSFVSTYIDWTRSNSNTQPLQRSPNLIGNNFQNSFSSQYIPGQNNIYPSFSETAYVTVSNEIHDTFMNVNREKSPYRDDLNNRVAWHLQTLNAPSAYFGNSGQGGRYTVNAETMINQLGQYGVKDLFLAFRSSLGIRDNSVTFPEVCPPSPWYGSQASYQSLRDAAFANGYLFAPFHDDKIDMFQQSAYWAEEYCDDITRDPLPVSGTFPIALDSDGKCKLSGWYTPTQGNGLYYYYIAHDKLMNYALDQTQCMQSWVDGNAHYLDVLAKVDLRELIDYSSSNSNSRTIAQGLMHNMQIEDFVHESVDGPITAEGGEHNLVGIDTYLAGKIDAHNREIFGREDAPVIPDFELMVYNRLSVGQGMGSIDRWVRQASGSFEWAQPIVLSDFATNKADKYRATTIAFGHSGFFDDVYMWNQGSSTNIGDFYNYFVKEYYLFSKLQELYLSSNVQNILYYRNGNFRDLSNTLKSFNSQVEQDNYFKDNVRLKTTYQNGLEVYVNRDISGVWQINVNNKDYYLPSNGWLALHPASGLLVYSGLVDANGVPSASGQRVDYVYTPDYIMANGRGVQTSFLIDYSGNPLTSTYLTVIKPNGWKLFELSNGEFCVDGFCPTQTQTLINSLNPQSVVSTSNPPWIYITRSSNGRGFNQNFGIQIKEANNPQWPTILYCSSLIPGLPGEPTCEFIDSNNVRFKIQTNPVVGDYDVRLVDEPGTANQQISNAVSLNIAVAPICGDNICSSSIGETCSTCTVDCGNCPVSCGNNICESGETCSNCAADCGNCPAPNPTGGSSSGSTGSTGNTRRPPVVPSVKGPCEDGIDNDGDGKIDYPLDLGCTSKNGSTEVETTVNNEKEDNIPLEGNNNEAEIVEIRLIFWIVFFTLLTSITIIGIVILRNISKYKKYESILIKYQDNKN